MTSYDDMYKREVMSKPNDRINNPLDLYFVYEDQKDKKRVYKQLSQKMKDIIDKRNAARLAKEKADAEADAERKRKEAEEAAARLAKEKADADEAARLAKEKADADEAARLAKEKADADAEADAERKRKEAEEAAARLAKEAAEAEKNKNKPIENIAEEVKAEKVQSEEAENRPTLSDEQAKQATNIKDIFLKIKQNLQNTPYVNETDIVISPTDQKEISEGFITNGKTNKELVNSMLDFFGDLSIKFDNETLKKMDLAYLNKRDKLLFSKELTFIPEKFIERFYGYIKGRGANPTLQKKMIDFQKHFIEKFKFENRKMPVLTAEYKKTDKKNTFFETYLKRIVSENPDEKDRNYKLLTEINKLKLIFVDNLLVYFINIIDYCLPFNPSLGTREKSTLKGGGKKNTFKKSIAKHRNKTFRKRLNKTFRKRLNKTFRKRLTKRMKKSIARRRTRHK